MELVIERRQGSLNPKVSPLFLRAERVASHWRMPFSPVLVFQPMHSLMGMAALRRAQKPSMHDIICPHCHKAFKVDESGYADILKQVRDADFHAQLHERLELAEQDKRNAVALAQGPGGQ
jgi:hypothetical protein